ncbi:MAG: hypothetical protein HY000_08340 [Planctomycetes bacterium]|nr:hypothetical protein [Planctomycetota bacterium]
MGPSRGDQHAQIQPDEMSRDWLAGVTGSCLWLALMGLVVHGWCTLALAWCMDKVLS